MIYSDAIVYCTSHQLTDASSGPVITFSILSHPWEHPNSIVDLMCLRSTLWFKKLRKTCHTRWDLRDCPCNWSQGRPSPLRKWCISPCFRFSPYFRKKISDSVEIFPILPLPKKFSIFFRQNFWWPFFSHRQQMLNSPYFRCFITFSPILLKFLFRPLLFPISSTISKNLRVFYILYVFFVSPPSLTMMHLCITQCTYGTPLTDQVLWVAY